MSSLGFSVLRLSRIPSADLRRLASWGWRTLLIIEINCCVSDMLKGCCYKLKISNFLRWQINIIQQSFLRK